MNWRVLTDWLVWRLYRQEPDVCAGMRRLFNATSTVRVKYAEPKWSKLVLQRDAKGQSLIVRAFAKFKMAA